jgi:hypothetical protein
MICADPYLGIFASPLPIHQFKMLIHQVYTKAKFSTQ